MLERRKKLRITKLFSYPNYLVLYQGLLVQSIELTMFLNSNINLMRSISSPVRQLYGKLNTAVATLSTDPYETTIRRRRQVEDPSIPSDGVECLKWTNWRMLRDVKRRHMNSKYWQYRNNLMSVAYCKTLPSIVRSIAIDDRNSTPRDASVNHLRNRCALTSRNRGKVYSYRLSRIVWRDLADHAHLSGVIRAKWS